MRTLTDEDVEAIALRVAALLGPRTNDPDPRLTRSQAAAYLNLPLRSFDRKRTMHPEALKPADLHPMRWSKNALDVFKMGAVFPLRRGRKRVGL